jgi:hypothetical protein
MKQARFVSPMEMNVSGYFFRGYGDLPMAVAYAPPGQ